MRNKLGHLFILTVLFVLMYSTAYAGAKQYSVDGELISYNYPQINIYINGVKKTPTIEPLLLNSRVFVHIRYVAEQFGAKVTGYDKSKVSINYNGKNIVLYYNKNTAYIDDKPVQLDATVKLINGGYTYVPIRFLAEAFDKNVRWDNWSVYITDREQQVVRVKDIRYNDGKLLVQTDGTITFDKFNLPSPDRLVLDLENAVLDSPNNININSNGIKQIRYSQFSLNPNKVRVVVEFDKLVPYEIATTDDKKVLSVVFSKLKEDNPPSGQPANPSQQDPGSSDTSKQNPNPMNPPQQDQQPSSNQYLVNALKYTVTGDTANVAIATNASDYKVDKLDNPTRVYVDLYGAKLGNFANTIDVKDDVVDTIKASQYSQDTVRVVVYLNKNASYQVLKQDGFIVLSLTPIDNSKKIIVIDAGHGGSDPGATGNNLREADVVLQIAKKLQSLLAQAGYNVVMTRTDDSYVGLYDRPALANQLKADVFVSIHANSFSNPSAKGTEILYFNNKKLAQVVHDELMKQVDTVDRGLVERPKLVVLNSTNMPSILVETAFISNPDDAKKLASDDYQLKFAQGIYNGIVKFLNQ